MLQRTFAAESLDVKLYFQIVVLQKQIFVWADSGSGRLSALVLAGVSRPVICLKRTRCCYFSRPHCSFTPPPPPPQGSRARLRAV